MPSSLALPLLNGTPPQPRQCGRCLRQAPLLAHCVAAVDYGYPWAGVLAEFKFRADPGWAATLADLMRTTPWAEPLLEKADWLIPVPLANPRMRERGFNQAHVLACELHPGKSDHRLLQRLRSCPDQHALGRAERLRNIQGAFAVNASQAPLLIGKRVVLIDDVMTTGATLHAAAQVLSAAGAAEVSALVLARADIG